MGALILATLHVDGTPVADYVDGAGLDPTLAPRPYLHPVRTLAGTAVTDALPADHRWHLGVGVALQDVGGWNLWGGPTYVDGEGYVWRPDHGRITHAGFDEVTADGFTERLHWRTADGGPLLVEDRRVRARPAGPGWELTLGCTLTNATDRPLRLGSPATNGRPGAGYGGLFWRLPAADHPYVRTDRAGGEDATHDTVARWLAWTDPGRGYTLVITGTDAATRADPWFVRVTDYPGVGSQLAARDPVILDPAAATTRGLRALVADGVLADGAAAAWAAG